MISMKKTLSVTALAMLMSTGALVTTTGAASARVVCNNSGDCWHTDNRRERYGRDIGATYHNDDWYFHQRWDGDNTRHYRSENHTGRGYYRSGIWIGL
jgi:hypothetical protein